VLAVVDFVAGLAIAERRGAATEPCLRLEHEHARPIPAQPHRSAQPRKSAADDNRIE
jgi:hypothetical protein